MSNDFDIVKLPWNLKRAFKMRNETELDLTVSHRILRKQSHFFSLFLFQFDSHEPKSKKRKKNNN